MEEVCRHQGFFGRNAKSNCTEGQLKQMANSIESLINREDYDECIVSIKSEPVVNGTREIPQACHLNVCTTSVQALLSFEIPNCIILGTYSGAREVAAPKVEQTIYNFESRCGNIVNPLAKSSSTGLLVWTLVGILPIMMITAAENV